MSILIFILVLALLVLSHEFGHFIVARKNGIRVDEFGFGFPPKIFGFKKGETLYSINLLPLGGFVKIHGEEGSEAEDPTSFASKSIWAKISVIGAGVVFNFILAWIMLSTGYIVGLPMGVSSAPERAIISDQRVIILEVQVGSPAEKAGLQSGDELINFKTTELAHDFIQQNKGKEIEIIYRREKDVYNTKAILLSETKEGQGTLGILMDEVGVVKIPWYKAFWEGGKDTLHLIQVIAVSLFYFIVGAFKGLVGFDQVSGPIGIVKATGTAASLGFSYILSFIAVLSVNLGIINIMPFPALDGGRILFLLIEKAKGSPISPKISAMVHGIGLALLLILMIAVTYHDILKLI